MRLAAQSAWNATDKPLTFAVRVTNDSAATLTDLSVVLQMFSAARSRSVYELSLHADTTSNFFTFSFPQTGELASGGTRTFRVRQNLAGIPALGGESALYPLRIDLRSGDETIASVRTPMIFLSEPPKVPLNLAWAWVLSDPLQVGPDGILQPGPVEADIAPGGRIDGMITAILRARSVPSDVVVSPVLVDELVRMQRGYRIVRGGPAPSVAAVAPGTGGASDAARLLAELRRAATGRTVEVVALPFGDVSLPAILSEGLGHQLTSLLDRGRASVRTALGSSPSSAVVRPPGSALDSATLSQLVARGARTLLVDPGFVPTRVGLPRSPPATAIFTGAAGRTVRVLLPDTGVQAIAEGSRSDPVLAAHAALGEMAATWFELPGTPGRGVAMLFPERTTLPTAFFPALSGLVVASPWLRPLPASRFVAAVPPTGPATRLPQRTFERFAPDYAARLADARGALQQFDDTVLRNSALKARLADDLLIAESGTFVRSPALGIRYLAMVEASIARAYRGIAPPPNGSIVTLTSRRGTLPLAIRNTSRFGVRVRVTLQAGPGITFAGGGSRVVTVPASSNLPLAFSVNAQTTGRFPLAIRIETLGGTRIAGSQMIVRSTAYNRVALVFTIGAALFLAIWWGRRFLPRRTS